MDAKKDKKKKRCVNFEPQLFRRNMCKNCFRTEPEHKKDENGSNNDNSTTNDKPKAPKAKFSFKRGGAKTSDVKSDAPAAAATKAEKVDDKNVTSKTAKKQSDDKPSPDIKTQTPSTETASVSDSSEQGSKGEQVKEGAPVSDKEGAPVSDKEGAPVSDKEGAPESKKEGAPVSEKTEASEPENSVNSHDKKDSGKNCDIAVNGDTPKVEVTINGAEDSGISGKEGGGGVGSVIENGDTKDTDSEKHIENVEKEIKDNGIAVHEKDDDSCEQNDKKEDLEIKTDTVNSSDERVSTKPDTSNKADDSTTTAECSEEPNDSGVKNGNTKSPGITIDVKGILPDEQSVNGEEPGTPDSFIVHENGADELSTPDAQLNSPESQLSSSDAQLSSPDVEPPSFTSGGRYYAGRDVEEDETSFGSPYEPAVEKEIEKEKPRRRRIVHDDGDEADDETPVNTSSKEDLLVDYDEGGGRRRRRRPPHEAEGSPDDYTLFVHKVQDDFDIDRNKRFHSSTLDLTPSRAEAIREGTRFLIDSLKEKIASQEDTIRHIEREKKSVQELLSLNKQEYNEHIDECEAYLKEAEAHVRQLQSEKERLMDNMKLSDTERSLQAELEKEIKRLTKRLEDTEEQYNEALDHVDTFRNEIRDLHLEMEEMHDQFREEEALEFRELQKELELTSKNCRILQFKLRKSERRNEQLENDQIAFVEKIAHLESRFEASDDKRHIQELEEELNMAKEVSVRLHDDLELVEEKRCRYEEELDRVNDILSISEDRRRHIQQELENVSEELERLKCKQAHSKDKDQAVEKRERAPKLNETEKYSSVEYDSTQLMRDLNDSQERENDLKEQLKFTEEENIITRKKINDLEEENESLTLQLEQMSNAKSDKYFIKKPSDGITDREHELKLQMELAEQEMKVLRRKLDEMERDNENLQKKINEGTQSEKSGKGDKSGKATWRFEKKDMENQVKEYKKKVDDLQGELKRQQLKWKATGEDIEKEQKLKLKMQDEIKHLTTVTDDLKKTAEEQQRQLSDTEEGSAKSQTIWQKERQMLETDKEAVLKEVQQKDRIIKQKDDIIKQKDDIVCDKDTALKERDDVINEKNKQIKKNTEETEAINKKLSSCQSRVDKAEKSIKDLQDGLSKKEEQVKTLNEDLGDKEKRLKEKDNMVLETSAKIADYEKKIKELQDAIEHERGKEAAGSSRKSEDKDGIKVIIEEKSRMSDENSKLCEQVRRDKSSLKQGSEKKSVCIPVKHETTRAWEKKQQGLYDEEGRLKIEVQHGKSIPPEEQVKQLQEQLSNLRTESDKQVELLHSSRHTLSDLRSSYDSGITSWDEEKRNLIKKLNAENEKVKKMENAISDMKTKADKTANEFKESKTVFESQKSVWETERSELMRKLNKGDAEPTGTIVKSKFKKIEDEPKGISLTKFNKDDDEKPSKSKFKKDKEEEPIGIGLNKSKFKKDNDEPSGVSLNKSKFKKEEDEPKGFKSKFHKDDDKPKSPALRSKFSRIDDKPKSPALKSKFKKDDEPNGVSLSKSKFHKDDEPKSVGFNKSKFKKGDDEPASVGFKSKFNRDDNQTKGFKSKLNKEEDEPKGLVSNKSKFNKDEKEPSSVILNKSKFKKDEEDSSKVKRDERPGTPLVRSKFARTNDDKSSLKKTEEETTSSKFKKPDNDLGMKFKKLDNEIGSKFKKADDDISMKLKKTNDEPKPKKTDDSEKSKSKGEGSTSTVLLKTKFKYPDDESSGSVLSKNKLKKTTDDPPKAKVPSSVTDVRSRFEKIGPPKSKKTSALISRFQ